MNHIKKYETFRKRCNAMCRVPELHVCMFAKKWKCRIIKHLHWDKIYRGNITGICRSCENPPCAAVCPTGALVPKEGGGVRLNSAKCIGCGLCKDACVIDAIFWNEEQNKPVICVQCGYCVDYCPYEVLELKKDKKGVTHDAE